jgi:hypothetical protein
METAIFQQLCPNYTDKPHAAVEGITQTYLDPEGNVITHTVAQYNSFLSNTSRTFAHLREYPVDLCSIFIRGLHPDVKSVFEEMYPNHSAPHDRSGRAQRTALAEILRIASTAESRVLSTQRLVARQMGQTFIAGTYASQAERTMSQYQGPGGDKSVKSGDSSPDVKTVIFDTNSYVHSRVDPPPHSERRRDLPFHVEMSSLFLHGEPHAFSVPRRCSDGSIIFAPMQSPYLTKYPKLPSVSTRSIHWCRTNSSTAAADVYGSSRFHAIQPP